MCVKKAAPFKHISELLSNFALVVGKVPVCFCVTPAACLPQ